jgi:glycerophosphoryl diester phosphodiesterase
MTKAWPYPRLFAHRGGGTLAPENTLAAIRLGQSLGYTAHEIDVKLSRDGVPVLMHDATLERTTNGQGRAADLDWRELRKLDAGGWHSDPYRGEPVPSFEEATQLFRSQGTTVDIEIKPTPGFDAETGRRVALATRELWKGAPVAPFFSSFSFEALMAAKQAAPEIERGWLIDRFTEADWERLRALDAISLNTSYKKFDVSLLPRVHEAGYRVMLYTVNEPDLAAQLLAAGVDGIFTDNLRVFAEQFGQFLR